MIEYNKPKSSTPTLKHEKSVESKAAMVDFQYETNSQMDTIIEIKVQNLLVVLNVEYIMVLTNVFLHAMPQTVAEEESEKPSLPPTPTHSVAIDDKISTSAMIAGVTMAVEKAPLERVPEMKVAITVKNPKIVILANAQDKDTNALFLHVSTPLYGLLPQVFCPSQGPVLLS